MADNASSKKKIQDNMKNNTTKWKATEIKITEILVKS